MFEQQKRLWLARRNGEDCDPFLRPTTISELSDNPSSSKGDESSLPVVSRLEMSALLGPAPGNNRYTHLGKGPADPTVTVVDNDRDGGFEEVLELYCGAVQGSSLSRELELALGGDEDVSVSVEGAGSLQVSIKRGSPDPSSLGGEPESLICTLEEYKLVVKEEDERSSSKPTVQKEEPPLRIKWDYTGCGYATGTVVKTNKPCAIAGNGSRTHNEKKR